ncbi:DUF6807 family protein [Portibacter lacus]|uniref:3-keto-alpha-glucoside-1,2-lyase/3-keto-2-hydroxy-glucal hydratase domain-containing protein n=1 Tax=Portibacter lacus TaxID=1099794 RepID=A0AA37SWE6_9BACT|nr:DUF6807 family protein [Portibacter lacus]GLR18950.1 hypothetical protein GCM10007940_35660 [Portibacter lacus]
MFKNLLILGLGLVLALNCSAQSDLKFTDLLNESNLDSWDVPEDNIWWSIADGVLNVKSGPKKKGSILWTKNTYLNFVIETDFLMGDGTVDSGIFLRSEKQQVQIGESGSLKRDMTGSVYIPGKGYPVEAARISEILKRNDWNSMKVMVLGNIYTIWVNEQEVLKYESAETIAEGPIGLQLHPDRTMEISFRNLRIAELPKSTLEAKIMENRIQLIPNNQEKKVDVFIDGQFFTSYIYPNTIKKPVLYPLITPEGTRITRNYPLEPSAGERVDHPHHVGLWFNYGDVNGLDFWNNSDAIKEEKRSEYGTILHKSVNQITSGDEAASLEVTMEWVSPEGKVLIKEDTKFIFKGENKEYSIDRITKLTALEAVDFKDNKEGLIGIRVNRALEHPSDKPEIFSDAKGLPTKVAVLNNEGVNGNYINAEGIEGKAVWGKRSNWVNLRSKIGAESLSLVILDHKQNVGYPTYWHARGYGLFAANSLGQAAFSKGENELNFKLNKGESTTFKHQIIVASKELRKSDIDSRFLEFSMN